MRTKRALQGQNDRLTDALMLILISCSAPKCKPDIWREIVEEVQATAREALDDQRRHTALDPRGRRSLAA